MNVMLGLDPADAAGWILQKLDWKRVKELRFQLPALCSALVQGQVDYLHACGALDGSGDTGEGEYDEDEAVEFLLDALLRAYPADDGTAARYCVLIDQFLPLFDDYLLSVGLLTL